MAPEKSISKCKRASAKVDARHALRLVDVMEPSLRVAEPVDAGGKAVPSPVPRDSRAVVSRTASPASKTSHSRPVKPQSVAEGISAEITALTSEEGSGVTLVSLSVYASETDTQGQKYTLRLLSVTCKELGLSVGRISGDLLKEIREAECLYQAVIKSMELLGYGSMSRRCLEQKLTARGFSREIAALAAAHMTDAGYLDDTDTAERFARRGVDKLWGPRRIKDDLFARGFTAEVVEITLSELDDVDFGANCATVVRKKYGGVPKDMAARRKLAAALVRLGYASEHINRAVRSETD